MLTACGRWPRSSTASRPGWLIEGLRLGYHNHDHELAPLPDGTPALEALAAALDPAVLLEVDTYWAAVAGQDVPALLGRLGERVRYLHVKDGPVTRDDPMTAVGAGRMPVAEILAAAPAAWHVVELDRCATDMMTAVGDSLAWLAAAGLARPAWYAVPADPVGVAVVGCGTISDEYLRNLTSFPDLRVLFCADLDLERAKAQAARYGVPGGRQRRAGHRAPGRGAGGQPDHPGRARRGGAAGGGGGQERLERETPGPGHRGRPRPARRGGPGRRAGRLRPRHRARRGAADGPAADRQRRHRRAAAAR